MLQRLLGWRRHATPRGDATPRHIGGPRPSVAEYNTRDARDLFSHLLARVRLGEEIVIAHAGRPVARLVPYSGDEPRRPGVVRAQIVVEETAPPGLRWVGTPTPTRSSRAASR